MISASPAGGQLFSRIDLSHAYQQNDMAWGVIQGMCGHQHTQGHTCAYCMESSQLQPYSRRIDTIPQGVPHVCCYIDDILVTGSTKEEHLQNLEEVLGRLQHHGVWAMCFSTEVDGVSGSLDWRWGPSCHNSESGCHCQCPHPIASNTSAHSWVGEI